MIACRKEPERHILVGLLLYLPGRWCPHTVCIQEDLDHHRRVVRRLTPVVAAVCLHDRVKGEFIDNIGDEVGKVVLREPLTK